MDSTALVGNVMGVNWEGKPYVEQCGLTQRLHIATEITTALIRARPREVMNPEEIINEAYIYADLLMAKQHLPPNP